MNSAHLYRSIQIIRVLLRYKEIKKSKTANFYCIVDYAHWGHHVKKKTHPIALPLWWCGKEYKVQKLKKSSISTRCNYETIDRTKNHLRLGLVRKLDFYSQLFSGWLTFRLSNSD
jgi:hypothetical protein